MIPKECKRLAEVDFPIAEVSKHAVREKNTRHGHPSTLHLWWARRPLASSRAMLMALLLPDPCDPYCPGDFKKKARILLPPLCGTIGESDYDLQRKLFHFIADFANWDNAHKKEYLELSRALIQAAHPEETPLVVDPFAGGGSIPLEALRIGCDAFASDLNPVACLILKVMLEEIPKSGPDLIDELRAAGDEIIQKAKEDLKEYYPDDADGSKPVAYIWARTVRCESPNCGAEIPLMRSFWLCKKAKKKIALKPLIIREGSEVPRVDFEIFKPQKDSDVHGPTVARAKATCLACGSVLPPERVRAQLASQNGGADVIFDENGKRAGGARLLVVVFTKETEPGRHYRLASEADYKPILKAKQDVDRIMEEWESGGKQGLCPFPDEPTPAGGGSGAGRAFSLHRYGINHFFMLFNYRQLVFVYTLSLISKKFKNTIIGLISFSINKSSMQNNSLCRWKASGESVMDAFGRQAMPIVWDFAESNGFASSTGDIRKAIDRFNSFININVYKKGTVILSDARQLPLSDEDASVVFTDPPYYDAIPYSDLSDFFLVWLKRLIPDSSVLEDPFDATNNLTPKEKEIVQDETKKYKGIPKDRYFFETQMGIAFAESKRILKADGIMSIVFAHKTTEGWEALLNGVNQAGLTITGSWPVKTEMENKVGASQGGVKKAMLLSSIHLVCRPRTENAGTGDWAEVLQELPDKVGRWMDRLENDGVRGADLVFSCIGPALEIFSRYHKVETAEGDEISIGVYLEKVWEVVGRIALEQILGSSESLARNGAAGALEEDARLTALFLWTLQSTDGGAAPVKDKAAIDSDDDDDYSPKQAKAKSGYSLVYDVARRFAQPLGIELERWNKRIIEIEKGSVRLIPFWERAESLLGGSKVSRFDAMLRVKEQLDIFDGIDLQPVEPIKSKKTKQKDTEEKKAAMITTLDKVHAAMILQDSGQANALRALIKNEMERGQDFQRLANSLSALYPDGSREKRIIDAMLLSVRSVR